MEKEPPKKWEKEQPQKWEKEPPQKWEIWAGKKKPSMKRRCQTNDYTRRGMYMITMATEGRKPILGTLKGDPETKDGENTPHVELSPLGEKIKECWLNIHIYHPEIEPRQLCIMPDHIHGILFIHKKTDKHLGHVINGFKIGCRKAMRALLPTTTTTTPEAKRDSHPTHGELWEAGFNDRIIKDEEQLNRLITYIYDNPKRLLLKRKYPEYFTQLGTINVVGMPMQAMGNRFLLDNPNKLQVQCSRHLYSDEIEKKKQDILQTAKDSHAVLVSPCISPGEQQISTAALESQIPLIVLLLNGFPKYFKPHPRYLEACANGRLLMISPFEHQNEKINNMRQRCLQLNTIAEEICKKQLPSSPQK